VLKIQTQTFIVLSFMSKKRNTCGFVKFCIIKVKQTGSQYRPLRYLISCWDSLKKSMQIFWCESYFPCNKYFPARDSLIENALWKRCVTKTENSLNSLFHVIVAIITDESSLSNQIGSKSKRNFFTAFVVLRQK